MGNRFHIYATEHPHSRNVCEAVARGTGFQVVAPSPLLSGGVAMYGFLRGLLPTLDKARHEGRPWVYIDRGYLRASYGENYGGYFRMTRDAFQHDGRGTFDPARWNQLALSLAPWRRQGRHVLVCPPGEVFTHALGPPSAAEWQHKALAQLQAATDRPIRIRLKPRPGSKGPSLADDLQDCHALVTYMSNTAVEAVIAGVPVFCTGRCAAAVMGKSDLREIEKPVYPERENWVAALAANQWTLDEVRAGAANHLFT